MNVTTADGKVFLLTTESEQDRLFINTIDISNVLLIDGFDRKARDGAFYNAAVRLSADPLDSRALIAKVGRQVSSSLSELVRLTLAELERDHVAELRSAQPDAQERSASQLVEVKLMPAAVAVDIGAKDGRLDEVSREGHRFSVTGEKPA